MNCIASDVGYKFIHWVVFSATAIHNLTGSLHVKACSGTSKNVFTYSEKYWNRFEMCLRSFSKHVSFRYGSDSAVIFYSVCLQIAMHDSKLACFNYSSGKSNAQNDCTFGTQYIQNELSIAQNERCYEKNKTNSLFSKTRDERTCAEPLFLKDRYWTEKCGYIAYTCEYDSKMSDNSVYTHTTHSTVFQVSARCHDCNSGRF